MNKMWSIRPREYDLALNRKEVLTRSTAQINLEDTTFTEISELQKSKYCMIPPICATSSGQRWNGGCQGLGGVGMGN